MSHDLSSKFSLSKMRWFRKSGDSPRLLSLSPLRGDGQDPAELLDTESLSTTGHTRRSRIDMTPARWPNRKSTSTNATSCYSIPDHQIQIVASSGYHQSPMLSTKSKNSNRLEKRNPLLGKMKSTKLACFKPGPGNGHDILSTGGDAWINVEGPRVAATEEGGFKPEKKLKKKNDSLCFSAKLKSISDRYLKSSTNKILAKLYRQNSTDDTLGDAKNDYTWRMTRGSAKLRSFSYGALPGLEEFQKENLMYNDEVNEDARSNEDGDSGILINDSTSSSMLDSDHGSTRCDSSASQSHVSATNTCLVESQQEKKLDLQPTPKLKIKYNNRCHSLDRREILKRMSKTENVIDFRGSFLRQRKFSEDILDNLPPLPPNKANRIGFSDFKLIRLTKRDFNEELGIVITKGNGGYLVALIVQRGLAFRDGTLQINDEIINVNGKRLRGLTMAEARDALCIRAPSVDLVICRQTPMLLPPAPITHLKVSQRHKPSKEQNELAQHGNDVRIEKDTEVITSPSLKKRFQKNSNINSSMCNKLHRRSMNSNSDIKNEGLSLVSNIPKEDQSDESGAACGIQDNSQRMNLESPISATNFCTLPRRPRSGVCTFHTVVFEKGPGKKSLGFTIVGGRDSPKGALGIFIKSILDVGQAVDDGRLRAGDEVLAVNGNVCHDLSHGEAVMMFKAIRSGPVALHLCRRAKFKKLCTNQ